MWLIIIIINKTVIKKTDKSVDLGILSTENIRNNNFELWQKFYLIHMLLVVL